MKAASTNGANALQVEPVTGGPIGEAAAKFSEATYPLASKIDWGNSQQIAKYLSEARGNYRVWRGRGGRRDAALGLAAFGVFNLIVLKCCEAFADVCRQPVSCPAGPGVCQGPEGHGPGVRESAGRCSRSSGIVSCGVVWLSVCCY